VFDLIIVVFIIASLYATPKCSSAVGTYPTPCCR